MKLAKLLQLEIEEPKESKFISITDKNSIVTFEGLLNGKVFKVGYNFRGSELKYDWDSKTDSSLDKRDVLEFIANEKLHKKTSNHSNYYYHIIDCSYRIRLQTKFIEWEHRSNA